jgi:hypothetical protein
MPNEISPVATQIAIVSPNSLPDITISKVYLGMQGIAGDAANCVPNYAPYEIRAIIQNLGNATAYNIPVIELSTGTSLIVGELGAGQSMELYFPPTSPDGTYSVIVDYQNTMPEISENNNNFSYLASTPTPPVLCPQLVTPLPTTSAMLSLDVLRYGVYHSPDWGEFQLTDGVYYRTPPVPQESPEGYTTRMLDPILYGDINADGLEDALVILTTQNGGTGNFIELAAMLNQNGSAINVSTIYLGDRVVVESGSIENGTITLNVLIQGPNDPMCCPSQFVTWSFVLSENQLIKLP